MKLKQENMRLKQFNMFVETKFLNKPDDTDKGWWAYDDVRVCNENGKFCSIPELFIKGNSVEFELIVYKIHFLYSRYVSYAMT